MFWEDASLCCSRCGGYMKRRMAFRSELGGLHKGRVLRWIVVKGLEVGGRFRG